jgi:pimeloyl-[acyl-carrier protein] methyl ester esterase
MGITATGELVLIHGWGMNSRVWQPVLPALESAYTVHNLDLPGHGTNAGLAAGMHLDEWAAAMAAAAPAAAVWLGWSLGGMLAMAAAARFPQQVRALVLVAATPKFVAAADWPAAVQPSLLQDMATELRADYHRVLEHFLVLQAMGAPHMRDDVRHLQRWLKEGGEPQPAALALGLEFLLTADLRTKLQYLQCPCLLVLGGRDRLVPPGVVDIMRRDYPRIDVVMIEGAGHAPFLSHPQEFTTIVTDWIKQHA